MGKIVDRAFFNSDWDDESLTALRQAFSNLAGGQLPILHIEEEYWSDRDSFDPDVESFHIDSYDGQIDIAKLFSENVDTFSLRYVQHIFETIFFQATRLIEEGSSLYLEYEASRKYSFGDTAEWWKGLAPETVENRIVWKVRGEIHS